jgi:hypothetical protein
MTNLPPIGLTPGQISTLEKLLRAGFRLVTFERYARYLAVEKDGFVALFDPAGGRLALFSQVGYRLGEGIGMLVETASGNAFVWHNESVPASDELLAAYKKFRLELQELLSPPTS